MKKTHGIGKKEIDCYKNSQNFQFSDKLKPPHKLPFSLKDYFEWAYQHPDPVWHNCNLFLILFISTCNAFQAQYQGLLLQEKN